MTVARHGRHEAWPRKGDLARGARRRLGMANICGQCRSHGQLDGADQKHVTATHTVQVTGLSELRVVSPSHHIPPIHPRLVQRIERLL